MESDPGQMNNLLSASSSTAENELDPVLVAGYPLNKIVSRLDALLLVLKSCKGRICREPWKSIHPEGDVSDFQAAMLSEFDHFYEVEQTRVKFNYCWNGYVPEAEGSMWETEGLLFRDGLPWHQWT